MAALASLRKWLQRKQYHFEVTFSIYMFTPWEKFTFYSIIFLLFSLTLIAAILYLPHHIAILTGRAWYYIKGENIDVAASVKGMSGILQDRGNAVREAAAAGEAAAAVTKRVVETVGREL